MTFSNLKKLIAADESGTLEFKKSTATLKSGAETLCSFLNGRGGTSTILMPQSRYQQLLMSRNLSPTSWESQPAIGVLIDDLDQNEIINTLKDITRKKRLESSIIDDSAINILTRLRLIENGLVTNAAVVLFAKEISGNYLQCVVRMARFKGIEKHSSHSRNPRITNVFFRRGFIEAMGIGTQEIIKSCVTANMKQPDFYEQAGSFVVRMWSPYYQPAIVKDILSTRQQNILIILKEIPLPPHEILSALQENISVRTLGRELQILKEKGYIDSEGYGRQNKWYVT